MKCLFCDNEGKPTKFRDYKELDCEKSWNFYPCCGSSDCRSPKNFRRKAFKAWALANGWKRYNGWRRVNASDWTAKL